MPELQVTGVLLREAPFDKVLSAFPLHSGVQIQMW